MGRARVTPVWAAVLIVVLGGCSSAERPPSARANATGPVRTFHFEGPRDDAFTSARTRGRVTAVLFVTTYDLSSQYEARQLNDVLRRFQPRINAGAVVLEAPKYAVLADAFAASMGLVYPVVMADRATLAGRGPFGEIRGVPTLVVLDPVGREVWRREGATTVAELEEALASAAPRK